MGILRLSVGSLGAHLLSGYRRIHLELSVPPLSRWTITLDFKMRIFSFWSFLLAVVALIAYKVLSSVREKRRQHAESVRRGCGPCPMLPKKDILGITRFRESMRATRADRGPKYIVESMDAEGKHVHTVQVRVLDYNLNVTRDPENARACFSSQSHDFDIGLHRTQSWKPLLGTGIFTSQGETCMYIAS